MSVFKKDDSYVFFVHIPKAGGSTIEKTFSSSGWQLSYYDAGGPKSLNFIRKTSPQHMDKYQYNAIFDLGKFKVVFTCVRDPITRFKSEMAMRFGNDFSRDINENNQFALKLIKRYLSNELAFDGHLRPQADYIVPGVRVYKLESGMSQIIESLDQDYGLSLNYDGSQVLSREKKSGYKSSDILLSPYIEDYIKDIYSEDYNLLDYKK